MEPSALQSFWRDQKLNIGLVLAILLMLVLIWALLSRLITPSTSPERVANPLNLMGQRIQLEIRNATQVKDVAANVRTYLENYGFDVVESGNAEKKGEAYTVVIDRSGVKEHAERIAYLLGVPTNRIRQEVVPDAFLDVTVVLGDDYRNLKPFQPK
ncbi:MAG: LytR C-terminal domain-containing protein [Bacteroidetes Order II. Incertae sedis bacterium]|nr:LytR C-terminal domain-containing protein [Bacteroidetes Order II. bacterium]